MKTCKVLSTLKIQTCTLLLKTYCLKGFDIPEFKGHGMCQSSSSPAWHWALLEGGYSKLMGHKEAIQRSCMRHCNLVRKITQSVQRGKVRGFWAGSQKNQIFSEVQETMKIQEGSTGHRANDETRWEKMSPVWGLGFRLKPGPAHPRSSRGSS